MKPLTLPSGSPEMSPAERFTLLPSHEQQIWLDSLTPEEADGLRYTWDGWWARPKQVMPEDPSYWAFLVLAGRGFGKTRTETEWGLKKAESGKHRDIALIGTDIPSVVKYNLQGPSGFLDNCPPDLRPKVKWTPRPLLTFPNGTKIHGFSAEDPESLRGFSGTAAICDELCAWRYLQETWDMLQFGLREGDKPEILIGTTPKPVKLIKELLADPGVFVVRGDTYENSSNLSAKFLARIKQRYENTSLGRQEIFGEVLELSGGLFSPMHIEAARVVFAAKNGPVHDQIRALAGTMDRTVVAIDPSLKARKKSDGADRDSDACGIVVAGRRANHYYVFEDCTDVLSPQAWAKRAVAAYHEWGAEKVIVETNQGGDMCELTLRTVEQNLPIEKIHAVKNKIARAEPVASLVEQSRVHHAGHFPLLEAELHEFDGSRGMSSPNRYDAYVYALLSLSAHERSWALDPATREYLERRHAS